MKELLAVLSHCPLFAGKSTEEIITLLSQTNYLINQYEKNEYIVTTDQPSLYLGIILNGEIEVQKSFASGKIVTTSFRKKGDLFGGAPLFVKEPLLASCDVVARKKSIILLFTKKCVLEILCQDNLIVSNILSMFAHNVLTFDKRIELLSYSSIQKKIAFSLLYILKPSDNNAISLPYSKKNWAEYMNVSRPSLSRELKKLEVHGFISFNEGTIILEDRERLKSILLK